ncbi:hypothetical protein ACLOJK_022705 [Asimina triloba]
MNAAGTEIEAADLLLSPIRFSSMAKSACYLILKGTELLKQMDGRPDEQVAVCYDRDLPNLGLSWPPDDGIESPDLKQLWSELLKTKHPPEKIDARLTGCPIWGCWMLILEGMLSTLCSLVVVGCFCSSDSKKAKQSPESSKRTVAAMIRQ